MTFDIALVLLILGVSLVLFITERIRMDVVALLVLGALALSGIVTPGEALAGFSNPAVITVWAMFMISGGLSQTGVAGIIGRQMLRLVGKRESRMVAVIMLTSGGLSAFMNNIGVAALLLPVVMDVARRLGRPPSRLLMPLAYGSLLGGLTTLIGTPPNLLVSEALRERGLPAFGLFDFTPVGGAVMLSGVAFVALVGRRWLPQRDIGRETSEPATGSLTEQYALDEHLMVMRLAADSPLAGKALRDCRLGAATGLNVVGVVRSGRTIVVPDPDFVLEAGDRLLVEGNLARLDDLRGWRELMIEDEDLGLGAIVSDEVQLAELRLPAQSTLVGSTLGQAGFRRRFEVIVLALRRDGAVRHAGLADTPLCAGDRLLVQARQERIAELARTGDLDLGETGTSGALARGYGLENRIFLVHVPQDSVVVGDSLAESRIGDALGLGVLGIVRGGSTRLMPDPGEKLQGGDGLLVRGKTAELDVFHGLQQLQIVDEAPRRLESLASPDTGLAELILSPRTALAGRTLRELNFRNRYGARVLAILREGVAHQADLGSMRLRFGDALLLFGARERMQALGRDPDFVLLTRAGPEPIASRARAAISITILVGVLAPVLLGWLPIAVAAVVGAALMLLTRCLPTDEAYRVIDWRSVFLIAGMLPLGTAMQSTGAASYIAAGVLQVAGPLGPWGVVVGLYLVTAAATMIVPTAALVVLMAPIAIGTANEVGISTQAVMMAVAMAASASFTSPISHPANVLVMGPGGYRFADYLKLGVPLTLLVMVVVLLVLPIFWPL